MHKILATALIGLAGATAALQPAAAQVAGSTTVATKVVESTRVAMGWSAKKAILGKNVYNDAGVKVGKVEDLIIDREQSLSYLIIGAGGFVGIGRHDVAVPISQVQEKGGRLVMANATEQSVKALPEFAYTNDNSQRDRIVTAVEKDIAAANKKVTELQKKAGTASADMKVTLERQISAVQVDTKSAQGKLDEMRRAGAKRWKEFEADLGAAATKLRKSTDEAVG